MCNYQALKILDSKAVWDDSTTIKQNYYSS